MGSLFSKPKPPEMPPPPKTEKIAPAVERIDTIQTEGSKTSTRDRLKDRQRSGLSNTVLAGTDAGNAGDAQKQTILGIL